MGVRVVNLLTVSYSPEHCLKRGVKKETYGSVFPMNWPELLGRK